LKICLLCARENCLALLLLHPNNRPKTEKKCGGYIPFAYPPKGFFTDIATNADKEGTR